MLNCFISIFYLQCLQDHFSVASKDVDIFEICLLKKKIQNGIYFMITPRTIHHGFDAKRKMGKD